MKREAMIPLLVALVAAGLSSAEGPSLLQQALQEDSDQGADGVLLLAQREVILSEDGRVLDRTHEVQRILTDQGLDAYGDRTILFNSAKQDIEVVRARTLRADGESVDIKDNALNVVTPTSVARAPHFTDVQEMAITLLGLERGAATDVEVKTIDKEPFRTFFWGREPLWDTRDIVHKEITIRVPSDRDIVWFTRGADIDPEVKKTDDTVTYRFDLADLPAINPHTVAPRQLPMLFWMEDAGPTHLARRLLSTAPLALDPDEKAAQEEADRIMARLELETADELWPPRDEALGWYERITRGMARVNVDRAVFGDQARSPSTVFLSGYGDDVERAGVLHTVFARMGYDPVMIAVLGQDPGKDARLHPDNVQELWLRIAVDGTFLYLDTAGQASSAEPRGEHIFVISDKGAKQAKFVKPASSRVKLDLMVDLTGSTPTARGTLILRGSFNPYASILQKGSALPEKIVEDALGPDTDMSVASASFVQMGIAETTIDFTATPAVDDSTLDITLPSVLAATRLADWEIWRPDRTMPLMLDDGAWEKVRVEVRLPEGARVLHAPVLTTITGNSGPLSLFHDVGIDSSHVSVVRRMTLDEGSVDPEQMDGFVELLGDALARGHNRIIVKMPEAS